MVYDDVPAVERITAEAFYQLDKLTRPANWPPPEPRPPERAEPWMARLRHLLHHDGAGCWVAVADDGDLVGCAAALLREGMWGLSTLAVVPDLQTRGIGSQLMQAALAYGPPGPEAPGFICSSHDPRAVRRYRLSGFNVYPTMPMWGAVSRASIPSLSHVRDGDDEDIDLLNDIDRACRGFAHGVDHEILVRQFALKVVDRGASRGYAYRYSMGAPYLLAATDPVAASYVMWATLAESNPDTPVDFGQLSSDQAWAIDVGLAAGLELHNRGYLALRGMAPPSPYIPSGHFL